MRGVRVIWEERVTLTTRAATKVGGIHQQRRMDVDSATVPASQFRRDAMDHSIQQDVGEGAST